MSVNKYQPHIFVLPEDDANRQIANGFLLEPSLNSRAIQILPSVGGWMNVRDDFVKNQCNAMLLNPNRFMVLLLDFDNHAERLVEINKVIPEALADRVFVLGALTEPEDLRKANLGTFEDIGSKLAADCQENSTFTWNHPLLQHNSEELKRMTLILKPILFP